MPAYTQPVSDLLTLGRCDWQEWHDYSRFGFSLKHLPELERMAQDWPLMDHDDDEMIWAPVHAWRVLGILATSDATDCLLRLLWNDTKEEFFVQEYLPGAAGRLGRIALHPLSLRVSDPCLEEGERVLAVNALKFCGYYHPEIQQEVIVTMQTLLNNTSDDDKVINTMIIVALVELGATSAIPAIEAAYERECIDLSTLGDLEDLEKELSLKEKQPLITEGEYDEQQESVLAEFLQTCGDKALTVTGVKGLMFAIANSPVEVPPDRWLTIAFGGDEPPYASDAQGSSLRHTLFNLLASIQETISSGKEVLPEICRAKSIDSPEFALLKEWSHGYGQGSNMLMDVWTDVLKHPQINIWEESWSSCMILLNVWSNADSLIEKSKSGNGPDIGKMLEAMPAVAREMAVMSHDVREIWQESTSKIAPVRVEKVGRNDPCPCGSGKKYKKCCGK